MSPLLGCDLCASASVPTCCPRAHGATLDPCHVNDSHHNGQNACCGRRRTYAYTPIPTPSRPHSIKAASKVLQAVSKPEPEEPPCPHFQSLLTPIHDPKALEARQGLTTLQLQEESDASLPAYQGPKPSSFDWQSLLGGLQEMQAAAPPSTSLSLLLIRRWPRRSSHLSRARKPRGPVKESPKCTRSSRSMPRTRLPMMPPRRSSPRHFP
jgi:hypothetical protein